METLQLLRGVTMGKITVEENDGVFEFSTGDKIKVDAKEKGKSWDKNR